MPGRATASPSTSRSSNSNEPPPRRAAAHPRPRPGRLVPRLDLRAGDRPRAFRRDGSVEALLVGPPDAVEAMVAACRHGPTHARVDEVVQEAAGAEADAVTGFNQVPTV